MTCDFFVCGECNSLCEYCSGAIYCKCGKEYCDIHELYMKNCDGTWKISNDEDRYKIFLECVYCTTDPKYRQFQKKDILEFVMKKYNLDKMNIHDDMLVEYCSERVPAKNAFEQ